MKSSFLFSQRRREHAAYTGRRYYRYRFDHQAVYRRRDNISIEDIAIQSPDKSGWEAFCGKYEHPEDGDFFVDEVYMKDGELYARTVDGGDETEYRLRFLHLNVELASVGDYFDYGNDTVTVRFREDGSVYIHQDCRCQGSAPGQTCSGEVSFDIPDDFYISMTSGELAEKCWCTKTIIAN